MVILNDVLNFARSSTYHQFLLWLTNVPRHLRRILAVLLPISVCAGRSIRAKVQYVLSFECPMPLKSLPDTTSAIAQIYMEWMRSVWDEDLQPDVCQHIARTLVDVLIPV